MGLRNTRGRVGLEDSHADPDAEFDNHWLPIASFEVASERYNGWLWAEPLAPASMRPKMQKYAALKRAASTHGTDDAQFERAA